MLKITFPGLESQLDDLATNFRHLAESLKSLDGLQGLMSAQQEQTKALSDDFRQRFESLSNTSEILFPKHLELKIPDNFADHPAWDLLAIMSSTRDEESRLAAAQRIAKRLGSVIHKKRWPWIKPELRRRAKMHGRTQQHEFQTLVVTGLFESIEVAGPYTPGEFTESLEAIRTRLNHLLTVDLLGPGWRKRTGASALQEIDFDEATQTVDSAVGLNTIAELEARLQVEALLSRVNLTNREKEVLFARRFQGMPFRDIAAKLKIKIPTARVLYSRAFKKIKKTSQNS